MKTYINHFACALALVLAVSCNDYLDQEPMAELSPEQYFSSEANLGAYTIDLYNMLPNHSLDRIGYWSTDSDTDDMAYASPGDLYAPGWWKVPQTGGDYSFTEIYRCNYFLGYAVPLVEQGKITGTKSVINHYLGEAYFFRAWSYFIKLQSLGDFPIVTECLKDELQTLVSASRRAPRNEVARFILSDLDKAIELMQDKPAGGTNRLSKDCARLFKSRVALYEGTWLKHFKGTVFVPGGPDWPGAEFNPDFAYEGGDIDSEIEYFLKTAMEAAKEVADRHALTVNTGKFQSSPDLPVNPYFNMFGDEDMSGYDEILLWRAFNLSVGVTHTSTEFLAASNCGYGLTKGLIDAFVMADGKPIYASSEYPGDADLTRITEGRDNRAQLFIKKPGDSNTHSTSVFNGESFAVEPWPNVTKATASQKYTTGYTMRKGLNFNGAYTMRNQSVAGLAIFRAAEAYLNYIEACYECNGSLDADARKYWNSIRDRARVGSYQVTIDNTDMAKEAETDWAAYSGGAIVDATLYNIRRERRCELMCEGLRSMDLHRWRAMDQMIETPYHIFGINLYDSAYRNSAFISAQESALVEGQNVSPREFSKYLAPYHVLANNRVYEGYRWKMAHYLSPIAVQHFLITGSGDVSESSLYQNPGWPATADMGALY